MGDYLDKPQDKKVERAYRNVVNRIRLGAWDLLLRDSRHPREKVRAGSLLLLCHHPQAAVLLERAREALDDPSPLVRLAGASALAWLGDPAGQELLIGGLSHQRWEIRWWCGKLLTFLGQPPGREAIERQKEIEPDRWVRGQLENMLTSFGRKQRQNPNSTSARTP